MMADLGCNWLPSRSTAVQMRSGLVLVTG